MELWKYHNGPRGLRWKKETIDAFPGKKPLLSIVREQLERPEVKSAPAGLYRLVFSREEARHFEVMAFALFHGKRSLFAVSDSLNAVLGPLRTEMRGPLRAINVSVYPWKSDSHPRQSFRLGIALH